MNFDIAFDRVIGHEGTFVDNPSDPGGATNWGITERVARANGYTGDMRALPKEFAKAVYGRSYWTPVRGLDLPGAVAFQVFDAAVNHGVAQASRWLQAAVGTSQDGVIGPQTIAAAKARPELVTCALFNSQRLAFYAALPTWPTFGKGWARRVAQNLTFAAGDAV